MSMAARARRALARYPWLYWAIVAALAAAAGLLVAKSVSRVETARAEWGEIRSVTVAAADVAPGEPLAPVTEQRDLPTPIIPDAAIESLDPDAVARQRITAGEIVVAHDVAATSSPQAMIPDGWLAVAISEPVASGGTTGDRVQVASGGIVLAQHGVVVGSADGSLLVAVPAGDAPQVAHAGSTGDASLLLTP